MAEQDLESDDAPWALYERWCKAFGFVVMVANEFLVALFYSEYRSAASLSTFVKDIQITPE